MEEERETPCDLAALEELASGGLPATVAAERERHVAGCAACREELTWLRRERSLVAARRTVEELLPEAMWRAVESRIAGSGDVARDLAHRRGLARGGWRARLGYVGVGFAAAMVLAAVGARVAPGLLASHGHRSRHAIAARHGKPTDPRNDPSLALDRAEAAYEEAIHVLEAEYAAARKGRAPGRLARYEASLASSRTELEEARREAGSDVESRARALDGYSDYMHTLQQAVFDIEQETQE